MSAIPSKPSIMVKQSVEFTCPAYYQPQTTPVIAPAGFLILQAIKVAVRKLNISLTISSACDGVHSGPLDPHHFGRAYDIRSHDFPEDIKNNVLQTIMSNLQMDSLDIPAPVEISRSLATKYFFGFVESPETDNEHFHIQLRRGLTFSVQDFLDWNVLSL